MTDDNDDLWTGVYDSLDFLESLAEIKKQAEFNKTAGKYDHIDFKPPESVARAAARGLELRKKNKGRGGLSAQQAHKAGIGSGVARAVSLKNRQTLSPSTVRRMKAFFDRHEKSRKIDKGKTPSTDRGYIAWALWGNDAGRAWSNKICRQMDAADRKAKGKHKKASLSIDDFDLDKVSEDYEPEGLQDEILLNYGPKPPINVLLKILMEHGVKCHAFGNGISVLVDGEKKIIPATLKSVMSYLGY